MNIAYIVLAHRYREQLIRLVSRLNADNVSFFIQFDKGSDDGEYQRMAGGLSHLSNIHFLERRKCRWGGFEHARATIDGIAAVLETNIPAEGTAKISFSENFEQWLSRARNIVIEIHNEECREAFYCAMRVMNTKKSIRENV